MPRANSAAKLFGFPTQIILSGNGATVAFFAPLKNCQRLVTEISGIVSEKFDNCPFLGNTVFKEGGRRRRHYSQTSSWSPKYYVSRTHCYPRLITRLSRPSRVTAKFRFSGFSYLYPTITPQTTTDGAGAEPTRTWRRRVINLP